MTDNLLSIFDPMDVELPEQQPDQSQAQEILEAKLNQILEKEGEALLQASDFIGYQVDRIRKANGNADICKQTIKQAQTNKKGWERETEFRRWAIQQSLEYLKAKGLLDKPQLTGPDYKVSVSQRQGGLEVSEDLQNFLEFISQAFHEYLSDLLSDLLNQGSSHTKLEFHEVAQLIKQNELTGSLIDCLNINVSVTLDKTRVKQKLSLFESETKHFKVEKNSSLTAKI